ncbi:hypothetical protein IJG93_01025 [Candidatus Saccharibacteria bacterium]|nr:hypothetical protein [Candidatus Saccharibacteria bacterium]
MGKKFTTLISTLTLAASSLVTVAPPALAAVVKDDVTFWSTSEIMDFKAEMLEKIATDCPDGNPECVRGVYISYYNEQPGKYMAYIAANDELSNFTITSVNPATETIKIFINNYERDWMSDSLNQVPLTSVYAVWGEPSTRDLLMGTVSGAGAFYVNEIENNSLRDGVYRLFGASRSGNANVFNIDEIPTMEEVEFRMPGSNLANNLSGDFYFTTSRESGGSIHGFSSYGSCFESGDYELGKECRLMFSSEGYYAYLPFSTEEATEEPTEGPTEEPTGESTEEPTTDGAESAHSSEEPTVIPDEPTENSTADVSKKAGFTLSIKEISTSSSGVPTTSKATSTEIASAESTSVDSTLTKSTSTEEKPVDTPVELPTSGESEHVFPWWIIAFTFSGIILTLWWFIPVKKFEKSVDKK